ncbi:GntR family transcriptional regulator [Roseovarius sp.]|uniref:GntR family transcriptional regulator n=1 Tax=Roseovarius sp. TaxID=1486281 RepID=UPI0035643FEC
MVRQTTSCSARTVHAALLERIVSGAIRPGESLSVPDLVKNYGVTRTPVQKALTQLEQSGLVERGPHRGLKVRRVEVGAIAELFEAVGEVESGIAALAAIRMTTIERQQLADVLNDGEASVEDYVGYSDVNARFHSAIRTGGHNAVLSNLLSELNLRTLPWRGAQFSAHGPRRSSSHAEHAEITAAILDRDSEAARECMRRHIASSFFTLSEILAGSHR